MLSELHNQRYLLVFIGFIFITEVDCCTIFQYTLYTVCERFAIMHQVVSFPSCPQKWQRGWFILFCKICLTFSDSSFYPTRVDKHTAMDYKLRSSTVYVQLSVSQEKTQSGFWGPLYEVTTSQSPFSTQPAVWTSTHWQECSWYMQTHTEGSPTQLSIGITPSQKNNLTKCTSSKL